MYSKENDWLAEDMLFEPKRKISNVGSWKTPHIIGSFYSNKMSKAVHYQSLNEFIFYALLELDTRTLRYYYQPVIVPVKYMGETKLEYWEHVPDALVFRSEQRPHLYQIKESKKELMTPKNIFINKACKEYAKEHVWSYSIVCPKQMPDILIRNIKFLFGFKRMKYSNTKLISEILHKMQFYQEISIEKLANSFIESLHPYTLLPVIYNMITSGLIFVNLLEPINELSEVSLYPQDLETLLNKHVAEEIFYEI